MKTIGGFEPVACTLASGREKGQAENQMGLLRARFFRPRLRFKSYEEIAYGIHSADVALNILARRRGPGPLATILTPATLTLRHAAGACTPLRQHQETRLMERTQLFDLMVSSNSTQEGRIR